MSLIRFTHNATDQPTPCVAWQAGGNYLLILYEYIDVGEKNGDYGNSFGHSWINFGLYMEV